MIKVNENYLKLKAGYLFPEIARRVKIFSQANPQAKIIRLGIGDVTEPIAPAVIAAMHKAVDEMAERENFKGYGPEQGYDFLRNLIAENDYQSRGAKIDANEIFVSDGSKCDTGNLQEIFDIANVIAVQDPVYPVYVDTNVMAGRTGASLESGAYEGIVYMPCTEENGFVPQLPDRAVDLIYLCYPNNPTGAAATKQQLKTWIDYAKKNKAIILFDAAYEAYITDSQMPHSIYEIDGARDVAIEFRSYSKTAGFTGLRCAFTVIPQGLCAYTKDGRAAELHPIWNRRHCTKFNGVSYVTQCAAAATYSKQGKKQIRKSIDLYLNNARVIREQLKKLGYKVFGGVNAPYVWVQTPNRLGSWEFFDLLLSRANVVVTPGAGFGAAGEGYFRISAFNSPENVEKAMQRIAELYK